MSLMSWPVLDTLGLDHSGDWYKPGAARETAPTGGARVQGALVPPLPLSVQLQCDEDCKDGSFKSSSGSFTTDESFKSTDESLTKGPTAGQTVGEFMREQDRFLPLANIGKIMARQLAYTGHAKISDDTKKLMQECATEFICVMMSEANDQAAQAKRKAVSGQDIINSCVAMEIHEMAPPLTNALPHLQPPKRLRGKAAEEAQGQAPPHRRRCRVSDEEVAHLRLAREARLVHQPVPQGAVLHGWPH